MNGVPLLLLVSARGGNVPTQHWISRRFAVSAIHAEFHDPAQPFRRTFGRQRDRRSRSLRLLREIAPNNCSAPPPRQSSIRPPACERRTGQAMLAALPEFLASSRQRSCRSLAGRSRRSTACASRCCCARRDFTRAGIFVTSKTVMRWCKPSPNCREPSCSPSNIAMPAVRMAWSANIGRCTSTEYSTRGIWRSPPIGRCITSPLPWRLTQRTAKRSTGFLMICPRYSGSRAMAALGVVGQTLGLDYAGIDFALNRTGRRWFSKPMRRW